MLIEGKYLFFGDNLSDSFAVRGKVFQEEQGIPKEIELDNLDNDAVHVVVYVDHSPVATGRMIFDGKNYYIGRVAVLKEERRKKYGDFVVRMLADKAFMMGAKEIYINSQESVVGFYEKIGFAVCGEKHIEADIIHVPMKLVRTGLCKNCSKE